MGIAHPGGAVNLTRYEAPNAAFLPQGNKQVLGDGHTNLLLLLDLQGLLDLGKRLVNGNL